MSTGKTRLESRPATRADILAFYDKLPAQTIRAWVLEVDGELAGVAGYYMQGYIAVAFSDVKKPIPKAVIWREAKQFMKKLPQPSACLASRGAGPFLERLGWEFISSSENGDLYQWQL